MWGVCRGRRQRGPRSRKFAAQAGGEAARVVGVVSACSCQQRCGRKVPLLYSRMLRLHGEPRTQKAMSRTGA